MQKIRNLSSSLNKDITAKRDWVRNHYTPETINEYETFEGKLILLDTILKSNWIDKSETLKLQCLGITLGDIIAQDLGLNWVEIEDEYGIDPALRFGETSLIVFPQTMISKRVEKGETVDIYELYELLEEGINTSKEKAH